MTAPRTTRTSSDSCWPLRCPDGRTFAQRAADRAAGIPDPLPPAKRRRQPAAGVERLRVVKDIEQRVVAFRLRDGKGGAA